MSQKKSVLLYMKANHWWTPNVKPTMSSRWISKKIKRVV